MVGTAIKYNHKSEDLGGFDEVILQGAFTECLESDPDIRALYEHDKKELFLLEKALFFIVIFYSG